MLSLPEDTIFKGRRSMTTSITRILVPMDFSAHADHAMDYATALAARLGASIELLHVVEDPLLPAASAEVYMPNLEELRESLIEDARRRLAACEATIGGHSVPVVSVVRLGRPSFTIVEYATTALPDLIVMGTHGRTGFAHLLMGSVAERVVRTAPCPVLTLRAAVTETATAPAGTTHATAL
jgi:universal stress protein A